MTTTTPSQDRAPTRVPDGEVPTPRTGPPGDTTPAPIAGWWQVRTSVTEAPVVVRPVTAGSVTLPRQRPATPSGNLPTPEPVTLRPVRGRWSVPTTVVAAGLAVVTVALVGAVFALLATSTAEPTAPTPAALPTSVSPNVSVPGRVLTAFGDGVWQVGVDIEPGTYASTGSAGGLTCHHALRATRTGGNVESTTVSAGPAAVVLTADDGWFETFGCATWVRAD